MQPAGWFEFVAPTAAWACVAVGSKEQLSRFLELKPDADLVVRVIDGTNCSTQVGLSQELGRVLEFPTYSPDSTTANWDSFIDWMLDLSWLPSSSYVIAITDMVKVLPAPDEFKTFLEVLEIVATTGVRTAGSPPEDDRQAKLTFVFQAEPSEAEELSLVRFRGMDFDIPFYRLP